MNGLPDEKMREQGFNSTLPYQIFQPKILDK